MMLGLLVLQSDKTKLNWTELNWLIDVDAHSSEQFSYVQYGLELYVAIYAPLRSVQNERTEFNWTEIKVLVSFQFILLHFDPFHVISFRFVSF